MIVAPTWGQVCRGLNGSGYSSLGARATAQTRGSQQSFKCLFLFVKEGGCGRMLSAGEGAADLVHDKTPPLSPPLPLQERPSISPAEVKRVA